MSKLEELIEGLCPDGVEHVALKEVCDDIIVPMRDRPKVFDGNIPWCRIEDKEGQYFNKSLSGLCVSDEVIKKMNLKVFPIGTVICSCSASIGAYAINTQPLITNQTFIGLVCGEKIYNKYLLYFMETQTENLLKLATTGTIPYISRVKFENLIIPIPPLPVQEEIVRILDKFTDLTSELQTALQAELQARAKQYEYYFSQLLSKEKYPMVKLETIGSVKMCKRILKSQTSTEGDIPFYKIGTFGKKADAYISQELFDEYVNKYSYPSQGSILISCSGTIGRTVVFDGTPSYFQDSNIVWLEHDETKVTNEFLRYAYMLNPWIISSGGTISRLYNDGILKAEIPLPSLEEQKKIVSILEKFDVLNNDIKEGLPAEIEARQKQYEYYRNKLLTFKELQA